MSAVAEDPRSAPSLRWGILGPGWIAGTFARAVRAHTRSQVAAVGSRSKDRAERFATAHQIPTTHVGYESLVADPHVDAIYVASPHSEHREHALLAIAAGKHVLVEKAFTRNEAEGREVIEAARAAGVFCMEAMWTRFLPHMVALRAVLARGEIGEVVTLVADHGQSFSRLPATHRLLDPALAGGALLDLGVYPVSFAHDLFGPPTTVQAAGALTDTGVDGQVSMLLGYGDKRHAVLNSPQWSRPATTAVISGTDGRIEVRSDFYQPTSFEVIRDDGTRWEWTRPVEGGFQYQVAEAARRIADGEIESPRMTHQGTLEVLATMDEVRRQIGVRYPGE